jgi:hypothetical protein
MTETAANRFNWRLPFCGALGAMIVVLPKMTFGNDIGAIFCTVVIAAIIGLIVVVVAVRTIRRQSLSTLSMLVVFCSVLWLFWTISDYVRTTGRWVIHSRTYKANVLAQANPTNEGLKHIEWDGWGFAGSDTTVYLVFDPHDSLAMAAKSGQPGKFDGIPCEVPAVQRLEDHWYTVLFYTDTDWSHCG